MPNKTFRLSFSKLGLYCSNYTMTFLSVTARWSNGHDVPHGITGILERAEAGKLDLKENTSVVCIHVKFIFLPVFHHCGY